MPEHKKDTPRRSQVTIDTLFSGAVTCRQHQEGYRFSIDAVLAAHFAEISREEVILDLGAGCGVISLILMYRWASLVKRLVAYEYQPQLVQLIEENFEENGYDAKCRGRQGDVRDILNRLKPESFTSVICNPPYFPAKAGRVSGNEESRIARHLLTADLDDFTRAASAVVKNGGKVVFVYPAERMRPLLTSLAAARLEAKRLQMVYSYPDGGGDARLVLVHCVKNGGTGCKILTPFYIYSGQNGSYSSQMGKLYEP